MKLQNAWISKIILNEIFMEIPNQDVLQSHRNKKQCGTGIKIGMHNK